MASYIDRMFSVLNLEPTRDERTIKQAYAKKVKQHHPEEEPEKWQELHQAYQAALAYAKRQEDYQELFEEIKQGDKLAERKQKNLENVLQRLNKLAYDVQSSPLHNWQETLRSEAFADVADDESVLIRIRDLIENTTLDQTILEYIGQEMKALKECFMASGNIKQVNLIQVIEKRCEAQTNHKEILREQKVVTKKKKRTKILIFAAAVILGLVLMPLYYWSQDTTNSGVGSYEAREQIVAYLNEKYPEWQFDETELELSTHTVRSYDAVSGSRNKYDKRAD